MKTAPIVLTEAMQQLLPRSKHPLAPLHEGISNAIEAILQRQQADASSEPGVIDVRLQFTGLLKDAQRLESIEIVDNGVGFDDVNYERFKNLLDRSKSFNNQGSGRIQFLHRAETVRISSQFRSGENVIRRTCTCDSVNYLSPPTDEIIEATSPIETKVTLLNLKYSDAERKIIDVMEPDWLKAQITNHFLLRFYLDKQKHRLPEVRITFLRPQQKPVTKAINPDDVPEPTKTGELNVSYQKVKDAKADDIEWVSSADEPEKLEWAHFSLPQDELAQNEVVLCSKNVRVKEVDFKQIKKADTVAGHRYLTAVYGDILNNPDHVSHSVDSFTFPRRDDAEKRTKELFFDPAQSFMFMDSIEEAVENAIPGIYREVVDLQKQKEEAVLEIAKAHGIPADTALSAKIRLSDNEQQITTKIFRQQADRLANEAFKIKKLFEGLKALDPTAADYEKELEERGSELLGRIPPQNKQELTRYVLRRQMVTWVLKLILDSKLHQQGAGAALKTPKGRKPAKRKDKEGLIHDLIFKRRTSTGDGPNDLWVLNEEFVHFEGCAELPLSQLKDHKGNKVLRPVTEAEIEKYAPRTGQRPDIFLYPEEGQCVLVEFKDPEENLSNHLNQMIRYCNVIANFSVAKIQRFYCYLIGEKIDRLDLDNDFKLSVSGDWVRGPIGIPSFDEKLGGAPIATAQLEVIKLSSIYDRARRRNKSFADKLGITDLEDSDPD